MLDCLQTTNLSASGTPAIALIYYITITATETAGSSQFCIYHRPAVYNIIRAAIARIPATLDPIFLAPAVTGVEVGYDGAEVDLVAE